ncbi:hypothetical protein [Bradyrhizobium sp. LHD-71]|uniref:GumC family protein n=1 Tax=Bradyrhizobium sp. LHD-71 TaxID=3072141 RepID=UPI00280C8DB8|nr:hypothetical protein [Bradyrhizobium sp. LHD-71]MDQ8728056.1 hypothetical protein [Bradyrhizobium sp. LHD-71]
MERSISSIFANTFGLLWRRQWILYLCLLLTSAAAFGYYTLVGQRYEAYVLLRAGQGIKERSGTANVSFGEGVDLQSRMESLSRIAKIDHVMQEAVKNTGYDRLFPKSEAADSAEESGKEKDEATAAIEREQGAIFSLRDRVIAKQEGRSDLLKITFRHKNPVVAASFLDELANALVAIHTADVQVPGAQEFFYQQMKRLEEEAVTAASNLENFSVNAQIYAVDEQRQLLLRRANELATQMSTTRGLIEERKGQKQAIVDQLQVLKPVTSSRTVTRIVGTLGGQDPRRPTEAATRQELEETPPLLLVKVYQDNMATLMKVSADLNGATELLNQLGTELENVNADLASLSSKEAEYGRLKRILTAASQAAAHYANRMLEEQINAEVAKKTQLSSLRVVQRPIAPTDPVFPQVPHLIILALVGGILLGLTIIVGPEIARASMGHQQKSELMAGYEDPVSLFVARQRKDGYRDHQSA